MKDTKKADMYALGISAIALFMLFALRAPSVGRDIAGYKEMYENLAKNTKYDSDTYWTEKGYEMLEIFFGRVLKADWQVFLAVCNGISLFSYYYFIKKHSDDPIFSLIIYVLIGYIVFDLSAVRNMLAIAICLFVVPLFDKKGFWPAVIATLAIITIATQIHSSAYIFFLFYFFYKIPLNSITVFFFITIPVFFFGFRGQIIGWAISNFRKSAEDKGVSLGGNSLLYVLILLFTVLVFLIYVWQENGSIGESSALQKSKNKTAVSIDMFGKLDSSVLMPFRMVYIGAVFTIFTGTNIFARMAQYGLIFTIILLPNIISKLEIKSRFFVKTAAIALLAVYFYLFKVRQNELDFLPYVFYWNG
ncbi:MAG: EpsG family protein [Clostridia bacterium]|nr:EpsG family protein [Clostridia bacterium]MBR5923647.1 EpsG family protein [Clostridia bacterium]